MRYRIHGRDEDCLSAVESFFLDADDEEEARSRASELGILVDRVEAVPLVEAAPSPALAPAPPAQESVASTQRERSPLFSRWLAGLSLCLLPAWTCYLAGQAVTWVGSSLPERGVPDWASKMGAILLALLFAMGLPLLVYEWGRELFLPAQRPRRYPDWLGRNPPPWLWRATVVTLAVLGGALLVLVVLLIAPFVR